MLLGWTFNFDPQRTHLWLLCSGWQRGTPTRQSLHNSQSFQRWSTVVVSIPHYSAPLSLLYSFLSAASFWCLLEKLVGRGCQCWPSPSMAGCCCVQGQSKLWCTRAWVYDQLREEGRATSEWKRMWHCRAEDTSELFLFPDSEKHVLPEAVLVIPCE